MRLLIGLVSFALLCGSAIGQPGEGVKVRRIDPRLDVVLLQDESLSLIQGHGATDPNGLRAVAATRLAEALELGGAGHEMALVFFASETFVAEPLSINFGKMIDASKKASQNAHPTLIAMSSKASGPNLLLTPNNVPFRFFTDIKKAIEVADSLLRDRPRTVSIDGEVYPKERHIILLTDGKMHPWPGDQARFGSVADNYLARMRSLSPAERLKASNAFQPDVSAMDWDELKNQMPTFRMNGYFIHAIGFSDGADRDLIAKLAIPTHGKHRIVPDLTTLEQTLDEILPRAQNIVTIYAQDFCNDREVKATFKIGQGIQRSRVTVRLDQMFAKSGFVPPLQRDLHVRVQGPGHLLDSQANPAAFRFLTNADDQVISLSCLVSNPGTGQWTVSVTSPTDLCGSLDVKGARDQIAHVDLMPDLEIYPLDRAIMIRAYLSHKSGGSTNYPLSEVTGRLEPEVGGGETLLFIPSDNHIYESKWVPSKKGTYLLRAVLNDSEYGAKVETIRRITVTELPADIQVWYSGRGTKAQPLGSSPGAFWIPEACNLGTIDMSLVQSQWVVEPEIEMMFDVQAPSLNLQIMPPVFNKRQKEELKLRQEWVSIQPTQMQAVSSSRFKVRIRVAPQPPYGRLEKGIYEGRIHVYGDGLSLFVPVTLQVVIPPIFTDPSLTLNFSFMMGKPPWWLDGPLGMFGLNHRAALKVATDANNSIDVNAQLNQQVVASKEKAREQINLKVFFTPPDSGKAAKKLSLKVGEEETVELAGQAMLIETENAQTRIPAETYESFISLSSRVATGTVVPIYLIIPKTPWIAKVKVGCLIGSVLLLGLFGRHYGKWKGVEQVKKGAASIKLKSKDSFEFSSTPPGRKGVCIKACDKTASAKIENTGEDDSPVFTFVPGSGAWTVPDAELNDGDTIVLRNEMADQEVRYRFRITSGGSMGLRYLGSKNIKARFFWVFLFGVLSILGLLVTWGMWPLQ